MSRRHARFVWLFVLLCVGLLPRLWADLGPTDRPILQVQNDLPVAYLLGRGQAEATLSYPVANDTLDLFGVSSKTLVGDLAPGPANAGFPKGQSGHSGRFTVGVSRTLNLFAHVARDNYRFIGAGLKLNTQRYGLRWNLMSETRSRPALTFEFEYKKLTGPSIFESTGQRGALIASKELSPRLLAHGLFGLHDLDVVAEQVHGPIPQSGSQLPYFTYAHGVVEAGLALTWIAGRRTDLTLGFGHQGLDRSIDSLIPDGGIANTDRLYLEIAHAISESVVLNVKVDRESNMLAGLYPFLYNPRSVESFREPFGWVEFAATWRGDLTLP